MQQNNQWLGVVLIIASLQFPACQQKSDTPDKIERAKIEYTGEARQRVRVTAKRAIELGIKTATVHEAQISGRLRKIVPAAAVVYDEQGNAWTFTNPDSLVFVRERVRIDSVGGDLVVLSEGPPVGAAVVISGASNLFSDEFRASAEERLVEIKEDAKGPKAIGIATMKEDGTIRVVYKTQGSIGLSANVIIEYKPTDEEYQKILKQVGGLKVGESKRVPSGPDL
ncbi:MAG: hypothetical protein ONB44_00890 [candidate division KSB1 bacterium]|nr:hypothetical protein [candidate division KSB1 bacterium]MDZ7300675.1 hypothetical protein [candidate division KSB1 bacterium]MDZ7309811.1 hypothetical protein [candidate division KSB1 bacterium]